MDTEDMEVESGDPSNILNHNHDVIREQFKYFKKRKPPPDLSQVIDFDHATAEASLGNVVPYQLDFSEDKEDALQECGLTNPKEWKAYTLNSHPGLIFICNPFTASGQRHWAGRCLRDLPCHPNRTNLDAQGLLQPGENWWKLCMDGAGGSLMKKLRWVTLGFHHDWHSKLYNMCDRSPFPADLAQLAALLARCVGFADYAPEAAIVNMYHADSTLAPHTDHSEWDMTAPLLSLSFGQSAIFLLGGEDRADTPAAMFVRSGDVIIMANQCRKSYHSVPRILSAGDARWHDSKRKRCGGCDTLRMASPKQARHADADAEPRCSPGAILCECDVTEASGDVTAEEGDPVAAYLGRSRININVRQVFQRGQVLHGQTH